MISMHFLTIFGYIPKKLQQIREAFAESAQVLKKFFEIFSDFFYSIIQINAGSGYKLCCGKQKNTFDFEK